MSSIASSVSGLIQQPAAHLSDDSRSEFGLEMSSIASSVSGLIQQPAAHLSDDSRSEFGLEISSIASSGLRQQPAAHLSDGSRSEFGLEISSIASSGLRQQPAAHLSDGSRSEFGLEMSSIASSGLREQPAAHLSDGSRRSPPWYVVGVFVIPVLGEVVQAHFHDSSPFDTHPINMWTFLFALLIYCIALGYYVKSQLTGSGSFRNIYNQVGYVSGSLASAALISVVVPPSFELPVFAIWIVTSALFIDATC